MAAKVPQGVCCRAKQTVKLDGKKMGRFKKCYGSNCLEVGNKERRGLIVDSQVSRMETAQKVTLVTNR